MPNNWKNIIGLLVIVSHFGSLFFWIFLGISFRKKKEEINAFERKLFIANIPACNTCGSKWLRLTRWSILDKSVSHYTTYYDYNDVEQTRYSHSTEEGVILTNVICKNCGNIIHTETRKTSHGDSIHYSPIQPPKKNLIEDRDYDKKVEITTEVCNALSRMPDYQRLNKEGIALEGRRDFSRTMFIVSIIAILVIGFFFPSMIGS